MTVYTPNDRSGARPTSDRNPENMTDDDRQSTRTEPSRSEATRTEQRRTMGGVSHTNPVTGAPFGDSQAYARGRTVAADGGEADTAEDADDETVEDEDVARVSDVDHTPREGAPDASAVYERGSEGRRQEPDSDDGRHEEGAEADEE
jgi:hypothetical protein